MKYNIFFSIYFIFKQNNDKKIYGNFNLHILN